MAHLYEYLRKKKLVQNIQICNHNWRWFMCWAEPCSAGQAVSTVIDTCYKQCNSSETKVVKKVNVNWQDTLTSECKFSRAINVNTKGKHNEKEEVKQNGNCDPLRITASWHDIKQQHQDRQEHVSACLTYLHCQWAAAWQWSARGEIHWTGPWGVRSSNS